MIKKLFKTLVGVLLIPVAIGTGQAFYAQVSSISIVSGTLRILERGVFAYLLFHVFIMRPVYVYVLGHEFVHVLATWLCGGHVVSFSVTPSGGNVITSKTNFFIELSPYFVPIYTILAGAVFILLKGMDKISPTMSAIFLFAVGVTLAFHFVMTTEVIKMQQPDIAKSGRVFSFVVIFAINLVVVMAAFAPFFKLSFVEFIKTSGLNSWELYRLSYNKALAFVNTYKIW
ncbi:hypothetical protein ACFL4E_03205 [Candidatus Omnitrophota bacterium]